MLTLLRVWRGAISLPRTARPYNVRWLSESPKPKQEVEASVKETPKSATVESSESEEKKPEKVEEHSLPKGTPLGMASSSLFTIERVGDEDDPNKWVKYGFKYAGALVVFFIALGSLRAYERQLEAEKARRDRGPEPSAETSEPTIAQGQDPVQTDSIPTIPVIPEHTGPLFPALKDEIEEEELSPLDEMMLEEIELETRLRNLRTQKRNRESDREKAELKLQLKQLRKDIEDVEAKKA